MQVVNVDPVPPRLLNPSVEHDLETICLKCLEKDPSQRFRSALALAEELARFGRGDPISTRSYNVLDRLNRTLAQDRLGREFHAWGAVVHSIAAIVFITYAILEVFLFLDAPPYTPVVVHFCQVVAMALVLYRRLPLRENQAGASEKQLWAIWLSWLVAMYLMGAVYHMQYGLDAVRALVPYPVRSVVTGMAFCAMGPCYWGRCYLFGLMFFVLSIIMLANIRLSQLEFGLLWTLVLLDIGRHLKRLSRSGAPDKRPALGRG